MADAFAFVGDEAVGAYVAERLERHGLARVEDVAGADVVFTYCVTGSSLEDAYFDDGGLVKRAGAGTVLVDLSPSTPSLARELSAVALVNDLVFVEAPLVVGDPAASSAFPSFGNLACYASCEGGIEDGVRELLEWLAPSVIEVGGAGMGQLAKASHTVQMATQVMAAVEASALARAAGGMHGVADEGSDGRALAMSALGPVPESVLASIAADDFESGYPVAYLMADVVAALSAAEDVDVILPQLEAAMHLLELMAVIGGADLGPAALALLYREEAEGAAQGLDWTRAEGLYDAQPARQAGDFAGDAESDYVGGFGGYSEN